MQYGANAATLTVRALPGHLTASDRLSLRITENVLLFREKNAAVITRMCCVGPTWPVKRDSVMRYDTRCYFNVRSKADTSQLNLPHGTDN